MNYKLLFALMIACSVIFRACDVPVKNGDDMDSKVESLLAQMTLEEKVGQMNQYNGFYDVTGPAPAEGDAKNKYDHIKKGWVGSMLNVRGAAEVRRM